MKKPVLLCPDAGSALAETPKTTARTGKRTRSASRIIAIFRLTCSLLFEVWVRRRLSHHDGSFLLLGAAFGPPAFLLLGAAFGPPAFVLLGAAFGPPAFVLLGAAFGPPAFVPPTIEERPRLSLYRHRHVFLEGGARGQSANRGGDAARGADRPQPRIAERCGGSGEPARRCRSARPRQPHRHRVLRGAGRRRSAFARCPRAALRAGRIRRGHGCVRFILCANVSLCRARHDETGLLGK